MPSEKTSNSVAIDTAASRLVSEAAEACKSKDHGKYILNTMLMGKFYQDMLCNGHNTISDPTNPKHIEARANLETMLSNYKYDENTKKISNLLDRKEKAIFKHIDEKTSGPWVFFVQIWSSFFGAVGFALLTFLILIENFFGHYKRCDDTHMFSFTKEISCVEIAQPRNPNESSN